MFFPVIEEESNICYLLNPKLDIKKKTFLLPEFMTFIIGLSNKTILIINHKIVQQAAQNTCLTTHMLFSLGILELACQP